jgi:predicted ATPase
MEKIEIKDFVGIKDITIEIKKINIFIGPQASGKSIIAKLLYYFKEFIFEIIEAAEESKKIVDLNKDYQQKFKNFFPSSSWGDKDFIICYSINQEYIKISRKKAKTKKKNSEIVLDYSDFYKEKFTNLRKFIQEANRQMLKQEQEIDILSRFKSSFAFKGTFLSNISKEFNRTPAFTQLYVPAGRSFFAHLKNSIFTFLSESNTVDPFLIDFGTFYEKIKSPIMLEMMNRQASEQKELDKEINLLNEKIICGKYLQKNGDDYLKLTEGRTIAIANSSSGQQETLPLIIFLRRLAFLSSEHSGNSVYIEEPEAHIFPTAQKNIVELISTVYNARKDSLQFFITTHSPYILTAFNNLIQAGILAVDATEEKIEQISRHVPKTRFLNPNEVSVYSLADGYCKSIIDPETDLIDANIIDEVSNELAIQFDELLDLEE